MEKGHRERLIEIGLYEPLPPSVLRDREKILERSRNGEKIKDKPCHCVIRVDGAFRQLWHPDEEDRCQNAELIAEKLYSWEAWNLVSRLEQKDDQQPKSRAGYFLGLYRICSISDWEEWEAQHSQIALDFIKETISMKKKIDLMHQEFGQCDGHTCRECQNLLRIGAGKRTVFKCRVCGDTSSTASDWAQRYIACGMFNKTWKKEPVMALMGRSHKKEISSEPIEGQMMMEV